MHVRSLARTSLTLVVLAALLVVLAAYALPQVQVPGVDTGGVEQRSLALVHQVVSGAGWLLERVVAVVGGAVQGAVDGARSA